MNKLKPIFILILYLFLIFQGKDILNAQERDFNTLLENPISAAFLKENLRKSSPRLFLTPEIERNLKKKLKTDLLVQNYFRYLKKEADSMLTTPLLQRELEGFRLLAVSRSMLERMTVLCMVYRLEKNQELIKRIDDELKAVCNFSDWNPQHFLDVAEMSLAVALAVDWVGSDLPAATVELAKQSLINKGIKESYNGDNPRMGWINGSNNWNAVCHGGMIAASLAVADKEPELAAKTLSRALEKLPNSLKEYAPDGIYPEGPTYWGYGTGYTIVAANALTTALGSDFGISKSPGFMESVNFLLQVTAPSGYFFNFADSGDKKDGDDAVLQTWFAAQTGDGLYFEKEFFEHPRDAGRFAGLGLIWLSQMELQKRGSMPLNWHGMGANPVAVFRSDKNDTNQLFLAVKGGKARLSHGNMDAGTFVLEWNGIRWVMDPGNQNYYQLNKIGFDLAGHCQECPRWTLLTKKNQGHSTITVNDERFDVDGKAEIINFKEGPQPEVTIDMTGLYFNTISTVHRKYLVESSQSVVIEDSVETNDSTRTITWGLMTQADVFPVPGGAILRQQEKELHLTVLQPEGVNVSVISLNPPPLQIDKVIENLKRIEIRVPAWTVEGNKGQIKVRLEGK
jgi:hypothetical protein